MASKAQILAYYELVLADLKVTLINFNIANIKDFKFMGMDIVHWVTYLPADLPSNQFNC